MNVSYDEMCAAVTSSKVVGIGWSKKTDFIGHTAMAISLNGKPVLTIDYGAPAGHGIAFLKGTIPADAGNPTLSFDSNVVINRWSKICQLKGILVILHNSETALSLIRNMFEVTMHKYDLKRNNCRSYVKRCVMILQIRCKALRRRHDVIICKDEFVNFWKEVTNIVEVDNTKIAIGTSIAQMASMPATIVQKVISWVARDPPSDPGNKSGSEPAADRKKLPSKAESVDAMQARYLAKPAPPTQTESDDALHM